MTLEETVEEKEAIEREVAALVESKVREFHRATKLLVRSVDVHIPVVEVTKIGDDRRTFQYGDVDVHLRVELL